MPNRLPLTKKYKNILPEAENIQMDAKPTLGLEVEFMLIDESGKIAATSQHTLEWKAHLSAITALRC